MARAICDDLQRNVLDGDAKAFGAELGKMITARGQGNKALSPVASVSGGLNNEARGLYAKHGYREVEPYSEGPYSERWFAKEL